MPIRPRPLPRASAPHSGTCPARGAHRHHAPGAALAGALVSVAMAAAAATGTLAPAYVHAQEVYRCGNTYTQEACKGGRVVDTSPLVTSAGSTGAHTSVPATLYLCESKAGGKFWARRHCHAYGAWVDRTETVPGGLSWQEQVAAASAQRSEMAALAAPSTHRPQDALPAPASPDPRAACAGLERRIAELDAMGRAGSRYYDLDRIRTERREARDQQFRLRC